MSIDISTPGLLFPAITLLLLAYTNRFVALATLARGLRQRLNDTPEMSVTLVSQIKNLKARLLLIRNMQALGVASFFSCVLCMVLLYLDRQLYAEYVFALSLFLLLGSLLLSFIETQISTRAISMELSDLENKPTQKK